MSNRPFLTDVSMISLLDGFFFYTSRPDRGHIYLTVLPCTIASRRRLSLPFDFLKPAQDPRSGNQEIFHPLPCAFLLDLCFPVFGIRDLESLELRFSRKTCSRLSPFRAFCSCPPPSTVPLAFSPREAEGGLEPGPVRTRAIFLMTHPRLTSLLSFSLSALLVSSSRHCSSLIPLLFFERASPQCCL